MNYSDVHGHMLRRSPRKRVSNSNQNVSKPAFCGPISDAEMAATTKYILTSKRFYFIRKARENPKQYLRVLSHLYMTVELVALMTPMIAMGIQWLTALCPGPPFHSFCVLFSVMWSCFISRDFECASLQGSCIIG